ncbi:MAG TPA: hypothetical protein VJ226_00920, partial [Bradyrhizobium sp.]|nr:hypothetical protein [Bradyrhizobium sp.]
LQPWSINWFESFALRVPVARPHLQVDDEFIYFNSEGSAAICDQGRQFRTLPLSKSIITVAPNQDLRGNIASPLPSM